MPSSYQTKSDLQHQTSLSRQTPFSHPIFIIPLIVKNCFRDYLRVEREKERGDDDHEKDRSKRQREIRKEGRQDLDGSHVHPGRDQVDQDTKQG